MEKTYISFLHRELAQRSGRNPRYSLRAFAHYLQIEPSYLSKILLGKSTPSKSMLEKIGKKFQLTDSQIGEWISESKAIESQNRSLVLSMEQWDGVSGWEHFAILSLIRTRDFKSDYAWIGRRLGITKHRAEQAVFHLMKAGLIVTKKGKLSRINSPVRTVRDVSSSTIKKSHSESISQAIEALYAIPISMRDISSITMAIDPSRLQLAKEKIRKFRRSMSTLLEKGERTEVYNLNLQLVPVTKVRMSSKKEARDK